MFQKYSKWLLALILPVWVFTSFVFAQLIVKGVLWLLVVFFKVNLQSFNQAIFSTILAAIVYLITLILVIGAPWIIKINSTSKSEIGLTKLPTWTDIFITPLGFIVYLIISAILILIATNIIPGFDIDQVQETGFSQLYQRFEITLAFITLVVVAPFAEEVLFRGYLFGKLKKIIPTWVAIIITSLLFGFIHGAWNLAVDTFALSIILCVLRVITGGIWAPVLLHMTKNGIAFYILFINPTLLATLVR